MIARSKALRNVSCHISGVASCLYDSLLHDTAEPENTCVNVLFAAQINNVRHNPTRYLDVHSHIHPCERIVTTESFLEYVYSHGKVNLPICATLQFPGCAFRKPRVTVLDCICERVDVGSE